MADKYTPDPITGVKSVEELMNFVVQEYQKISDFLEGVLTKEIPELSKEPLKPRERMIVAADGIQWNPGSGKGIYTYLNGKWLPLAATQTIPPDIPDPGGEDPEEEPGEPGEIPTEDGIAIPTFHSMGLYWKPPSAPASGYTVLEYRKTGLLTWQRAHDMWYDARNDECRGSVVYLDPNTEYDFQFSMTLGSPLGGLRAKTWNENFPEGQVVEISGTRNTTLAITSGGTADNYKVYQPPAGGSGTIDVANAQDSCLVISAPYVIIRGLTIKGAQRHAIRFEAGAHDVVIEHCDISNWGRKDTLWTSRVGWDVAVDGDSAMHAFQVAGMDRIIFQYNLVHSPRYGSFPWEFGHPKGSNGIYFHNSGHNHVFRWNSFIADLTMDPTKITKFFMDAGFGGENFSLDHGSPGNDSDVYGNFVWGCMDDGLECEGSQRNVRVWGNYIDMTAVGIGTTVVHRGPQYLFRNVWNRSRHFHTARTWDNDDRIYFFKAATNNNSGKGMRFVFHNTMLQHPPLPGSTQTMGGGQGLSGYDQGLGLSHTKSRNNILHVWKDNYSSVYVSGTGDKLDLDYDLYNGTLGAVTEPNGKHNRPTYKSGHGPEFLGKYQLASGTDGHNQGQVIPNFNDGYLGAAPDMGAHEEGTPDLIFGHLHDGKGAGEPP